MYDKIVIFDYELVLVGSMNFYFSVWGLLGLNEVVFVIDDLQVVVEQDVIFECVWQLDIFSCLVLQEWWLKFVWVNWDVLFVVSFFFLY